MSILSTFKPLANQRLFFITAFGFASGLPIALAGSTLQAWLTEANISLMSIGILSLLSFPYSCKFLWAPVLDRFIFAGLGRRRGWILLTQAGLALSLFTLATFNPQSQIQNIAWFALIISFISATQDIAIDAYRADILEAHERGLGSAYFIFAYRMALFFSGGLALICAHYWGWAHMFQGMGVVMLVTMLFTFLAPEPQTDLQTQRESILAPFKDLWHRPQVVSTTALVILYKAGAALAVALMTTFLLKGLGFSLIEIGLASKAAIIIGTLLGAFVGGIFMTRMGLYASLLWFGLAQAFSILSFLLLALVGKSFVLMVATLFIENFCSGMSTAAFMALLMSLCRPQFSATQFAFLSAIDSLPRLVAGPVAALLVTHYGWPSLFTVAFMLSFPALLILLTLRQRVSFDAQIAYS